MTLAILNNLIDLLTASVWTYPLLLGICLGDAVFPILPSETAMIVCGLQAARGHLSLGWVIVFGALGAFLGDNLSYAGGRWIGQPLVDRSFSGERARERLEWAGRFLHERGSYVLIVARFVPGGRTATTFTSGLVRLRWLTRFAPYVLIAAVLWATYGALLGYLGGRLFRDHPIYALLVAFGIAAAVAAAAEGGPWLRKRGWAPPGLTVGVGLVGIYPQAALGEWDSGPAVRQQRDPGDRALDRRRSRRDQPELRLRRVRPDARGRDRCRVRNRLARRRRSGQRLPRGERRALAGGPPARADRRRDRRAEPVVLLLQPLARRRPRRAGENIPVAVPTWASASGYASGDGTSFSSPLVAGAAAWVWTRRPELDVTQLFDLMRWSATDIDPRGFDVDTGWGLLNVPAALAAVPPPVDPDEPNDDIYQVVAGKLFRNAEPPPASPGHGRAEVTARLDVTEDPEDVFRVWVPGHGRVAIRVDAVGLRFRCGEAQPPLLDGSGSDGDRTENVAFRNRTRRGRFVYLDVYPPEHGARSSEYRLRLATTH